MSSFEQPLSGLPELNIVVLGETGVGKSTFINASANYVSLNSLEDALFIENLQCVIPSFFTRQSLEGSDYVTKHISVLPTSRDQEYAVDNEDDHSAGHSDTKVSMTYTFTTATGCRISLIDIPALEDRRGAWQDQKSKNDIRAKLRTVKELHGILVLLETNHGRISLMFKFLKELLGHHNCDRATKVVFGFTNAASTSFRPAGTYGRLKWAFEEYDKSAGIQLSRKNTYCFDFESFRCLAAHQHGVDIYDLGDIEGYKLSWQKSMQEVSRLIQHLLPLQTAPPHTAETVELHVTRVLIKALTIPMTDTMQTINNNIALLKDQQAKLADWIARGEVLESALRLTKLGYMMRRLDRPHTDYHVAGCVELKSDQATCKSPCHAHCPSPYKLVYVACRNTWSWRLKSMCCTCPAVAACDIDKGEVDEIQRKDPVGAAAFQESQDCSVCGNPWQLHLHAIWEPFERSIEVEDEAVSTRISANATGAEVMETAVKSRQALIKKYEEECRIFHNSTEPYIDLKLKYLNRLVEEESGKVHAGGQRLNDLSNERKQHREETKALAEYSKAGANLLDRDGISNLVNQLSALELSGNDFKNLAFQLQAI